MDDDVITGTIIGCAFDVSNELGAGFLESVHERALMVALEQHGIKAIAQHAIAVSFRGHDVGRFTADILVEDRVLVELKAVKTLAPEHHAQIINYLKATGMEVGLFINFGNSKMDFRRFNRRKVG